MLVVIILVMFEIIFKYDFHSLNIILIIILKVYNVKS